MRRGNTYPAPPASTTPYLEQISGAEKGRTFELSRDRLSIGRTLDNDIVLPSDAVSRCHAYVLRDQSRNGERYRIQDNGSKNGVSVNGVQVRERTLAAGDIVQVGNYVFRFQVGAPAVGFPGSITLPRNELPPAVFPPGYSPYGNPDSEFVATPEEFRGNPNRVTLYTAVIFALAAVGWWALPRGIGRSGGETTKRREPAIERFTEPAREVVAEETAPRRPLPRRNVDEPVIGKMGQLPPSRPKVPEPVAPPAPPPADVAAAVPAKLNEKQELAIYLSEGVEFLKRGDFENAAAAFQIAIVIDPKNATAMKGIKAAEYRKKSIDGISLDSVPAAVRPRRETASVDRKNASHLPEEMKRPTAKELKIQVKELFRRATKSLEKKSYSEAIGFAEEVRRVEIKGDTTYLNEAKQIIDKARDAQKEEYEPFLMQAREMQSSGDWSGSLDLCEEMLKRDPGYAEARECAAKAREKLGREKSSGT